MNTVELLVGVAEIAIALAGFTGVVVAFGSRSEGSWHPGDRLAGLSGLWAVYMTWSLWASRSCIEDNADAQFARLTRSAFHE